MAFNTKVLPVILIFLAVGRCHHDQNQKKRSVYGEETDAVQGSGSSYLQNGNSNGFVPSVNYGGTSDGGSSGGSEGGLGSNGDSSYTYGVPSGNFQAPSAVSGFVPSFPAQQSSQDIPSGLSTPQQILAGLLLGRHITVHNRIAVPILRPYPVPVHRDVAVPVPQPVAVPVERPVPVPVAQPYPVAVIRSVNIPVEKRVPYPVPHAVPYPVYKPVAVPVAKPVPVPIVKNVPVPLFRPVVVRYTTTYCD